MAGFCPDDWHQTTEADLQQKALGSGDYEYAVWEALSFGKLSAPTSQRLRLNDLEARQKIVTDKAHAMAERLNLIPYTQETFLRLMEEVERQS